MGQSGFGPKFGRSKAEALDPELAEMQTRSPCATNRIRTSISLSLSKSDTKQSTSHTRTEFLLKPKKPTDGILPFLTVKYDRNPHEKGI
jgi:hypothetical protein